MADFYGVIIDYLLGREAAGILNPIDPIARQALSAFHGRPLALDMVMACRLVWVEPISPDRALREELRGWYTRRSHWVENDCGNRFFLGSYGVKWLAFESPI